MRRLGQNAERYEIVRDVYPTAQLRPATTNSYTKPANHFYRLCAWILDTAMYTLVQIVVALAMLFLGMALFDLPLHRLSGLLKHMEAMEGYSPTLSFSSSVGLAAAVFPAAFLIMQCVYFAFFESACNGKTPGKYLLGIQILDASDLPPSFNRAFKRNICKWSYWIALLLGTMLCVALARNQAILPTRLLMIPTLLVSFILLAANYGSIFFSKQNQALHDKWSSCYVVIDRSYDHNLRLAFSCLSISILSLWMALAVMGYQEERTNSTQTLGAHNSYKLHTHYSMTLTPHTAIEW